MLQTYVTDLKLQTYAAKMHIKINKEEADWADPQPHPHKNMGIVLFTADRYSLVNNFYEGILTFEGNLKKLLIVIWVTYMIEIG